MKKFSEWLTIREMGSAEGIPGAVNQKKLQGSFMGAKPNGKPYPLSSVGDVSKLKKAPKK